MFLPLFSSLNICIYCERFVERDSLWSKVLGCTWEDATFNSYLIFTLSSHWGRDCFHNTYSSSADERLNDVVGSAYYVAPEVLYRSYSFEADMWSIGVIAYILLCGGRPFWARTESGIFRSVLRADPNFDDSPWPTISAEAKDFVKRLLNKDHRKRMTAAQALSKFFWQFVLRFLFFSSTNTLWKYI